MIPGPPPNKMVWSIAAALVLAAPGCDGCSTPEIGSSPPAVDELEGTWEVASYGADEEGCQPEAAQAPYEEFNIEYRPADDETPPRLSLHPCWSTNECSETAPAESKLEWDDELRRGDSTHAVADLVEPAPSETHCRLSVVQTVAIPDASGLEMTRSYYEMTLPIEGDQQCRPDLAEAYHSHMECARSEQFERVRTDELPEV